MPQSCSAGFRWGSHGWLPVAALLVVAASLAWPAGAQARDDFPCEPAVRQPWSTTPVQRCPLTSPLPPSGWVPVYAAPVGHARGAPLPAPAGWLHGTTNQYFVCQRRFPAALFYHPAGWRNNWWAYTKSDDGVWGWTPQVFFRGGADDEADGGLRQCAEPPAPRPPASPLDYVALGDSFASGESLGDYIADGTWCHRSRGAYAFRLALPGRSYRTTLRACSGATTLDVQRNQLSWVNSGTDLVTLQAGGNDVDFGPLIIQCVRGDCKAGIERAQERLRSVLAPRLSRLYAAVRRRLGPRPPVVVVGYPRLFPADPDREGYRCRNFVLPRIRADEQRKANQLAGDLNETLRDAARQARFRYLDPGPVFDGHDPCSPERYLNAYIAPQRRDVRAVIGSFHPTAAGHAAYARALAGLVR